MIPPDSAEPDRDRQALVADAKERIAAKKARLEDERLVETPGADAGFRERYDHLLDELHELLAEIPEMEIESHGPDGLKVRFSPTGREVRITPLDEQQFVHFVFGHTTLGTLHRAEHHASRPFADQPPDLPRLARQLLNFLIEGHEPGWISHRAGAVREPPPDGESAERADPDRDESEELELPLE